MPVSVPFFTVSAQVGAAQAPLLQTPETQSVTAPQVCPVVQVGPQKPPQSMSDSVPFFALSVQVAAWQMAF
jgi:hypothetical protein